MSKLLSIVTITYNDRKGFFRTIESVSELLDSSMVEIIVVDGAKEYVRCEFSEKWDLLLISGKDRGIYDAMNKGIDSASGNYIWFLNGGDVAIEAEKLIQLIRNIALPGKIKFIYGDYKIFRGSIYRKKAKSYRRIVKGMFTSHQAMIYDRETIIQNNLNYSKDYELISDLIFTYDFLNVIDENQICYFDRDLALFNDYGISSNFFKGIVEQYSWRRSINTFMITNLAICFRQIMGNMIKLLIWN